MQALADGGALELLEGWLDDDEATALFETLRSRVAWQHEPIRVAGREILQPRLTAWYGDPGARYAYSGLSLAPAPWTPALAELRRRVQVQAGRPFNSVLCNFYRDGSDSVGFHADD